MVYLPLSDSVVTPESLVLWLWLCVKTNKQAKSQKYLAYASPSGSSTYANVATFIQLIVLKIIQR